MNRNLWVNILTVLLVFGLLLTVSCAKKTVVSEPATVEDQSAADAEAARKAEEERIRQQELKDQMAREEAERQAKIATAKKRFFNENVLFGYDSSRLTAEAKMLLKEKAEWLNANPSVSVTVQGHCDERGTTEYNLALGERRASAAKNYLMDLGISPARLRTVSFGEERPIDPGHNESAWRLNRRAQFVLN